MRLKMAMVTLAACAAPLPAHAVIGARAGVVSFAIGKVYLDNQRIEISPTLLKVFGGRAAVARSGGKAEAGGGRTLAFDAATAEKFDVRGGDGLDLWNHQRAIVLARARGGRQLSLLDLAVAAAHGADAGVRSSNGSDPDIGVGGPRSSAPATLSRPPLDMGCKF
jgi:hypothetical protein